MKLPTIVITATAADEHELVATFNVSNYMSKDAAILRSKCNYFIDILISHRHVLDSLVESAAKKVADGIRAEERSK